MPRFAAIVVALAAALPLPAADPKLAAEFSSEIRPLFVSYCGDCHKKGKDVPFLAAQRSTKAAPRPSTTA